MENTLERLVERIYADGVSKAEGRAAAIVAEAEAKAAQKIREAENDAARIRQTAQNAAAEVSRSVHAELAMTATRFLGQLKNDISNLLAQKTFVAPLREALDDAEFVKTLLMGLVANQEPGNLVVTVPGKMQATLTHELSGALASKLAGLEIRGGALKGGFTVAVKGAGYEVEFSEATVLEFLRPYLKAGTAVLFTGQHG